VHIDDSDECTPKKEVLSLDHKSAGKALDD
jgi:hypothetical protein